MALASQSGWARLTIEHCYPIAYILCLQVLFKYFLPLIGTSPAEVSKEDFSQITFSSSSFWNLLLRVCEAEILISKCTEKVQILGTLTYMQVDVSWLVPLGTFPFEAGAYLFREQVRMTPSA